MNNKKIDMLDPTNQECWKQLIELCEYYQTRCHEAEELLMNVSDPFRFMWSWKRFRLFNDHVKKWQSKLPKLFTNAD